MENKGLDTRLIKKQLINLLEKKIQLEPEYDKLREELDALNVQISALSQALKAAGVDPYKLREKVRPPKPPVEPVRKIQTIPDMIEGMLRAYKRPMHYKEIWRQLNSSMIDVGGKDRANTTLAYITRNKSRFVKAPEVGRGYYKIKE